MDRVPPWLTWWIKPVQPSSAQLTKIAPVFETAAISTDPPARRQGHHPVRQHWSRRIAGLLPMPPAPSTAPDQGAGGCRVSLMAEKAKPPNAGALGGRKPAAEQTPADGCDHPCFRVASLIMMPNGAQESRCTW